jgi:hypothetical protein
LLSVCLDDGRFWGSEMAAIDLNHHQSRRWFFNPRIRPNRACGWAILLAATAGSWQPIPYESMVVLLKKRFLWFGGYWSGG